MGNELVHHASLPATGILAREQGVRVVALGVLRELGAMMALRSDLVPDIRMQGFMSRRAFHDRTVRHVAPSHGGARSCRAAAHSFNTVSHARWDARGTAGSNNIFLRFASLLYCESSRRPMRFKKQWRGDSLGPCAESLPVRPCSQDSEVMQLGPCRVPPRLVPEGVGDQFDFEVHLIKASFERLCLFKQVSWIVAEKLVRESKGPAPKATAGPTANPAMRGPNRNGSGGAEGGSEGPLGRKTRAAREEGEEWILYHRRRPARALRARGLGSMATAWERACRAAHVCRTHPSNPPSQPKAGRHARGAGEVRGR